MRHFLFCVYLGSQRAVCQAGFRKPPDSEGFTVLKTHKSFIVFHRWIQNLSTLMKKQGFVLLFRPRVQRPAFVSSRSLDSKVQGATSGRAGLAAR